MSCALSCMLPWQMLWCLLISPLCSFLYATLENVLVSYYFSIVLFPVCYPGKCYTVFLFLHCALSCMLPWQMLWCLIISPLCSFLHATLANVMVSSYFSIVLFPVCYPRKCYTVFLFLHCALSCMLPWQML